MNKFILLILTTLLSYTTASHAELVDLTTNQKISDVGVSNESFEFSSNEARWKRLPRIKPRFLEGYVNGDIIHATIKLKVNKKGYITSAQITESTGNQRADMDIIKQVRRSKLMPFKRNGVAVSGVVTVPINIHIVEPELEVVEKSVK